MLVFTLLMVMACVSAIMISFVLIMTGQEEYISWTQQTCTHQVIKHKIRIESKILLCEQIYCRYKHCLRNDSN